MAKQTKIKPTDKMSETINNNAQILMSMSRFGISLGFGEKCIKDICDSQNVDCDTFLAVANFICKKEYKSYPISLESLMGYLKKAHNSFLEFSLPTIRRKLLDAIDCSGADDVGFLIIKFYDEYVKEVKAHMEHENKNVFRYVEMLLKGYLCSNYNIGVFASKHNDIAPRLKDLKDIIIRYYPQKDNELLSSVLYDIINCECDLYYHCQIENRLFIPEVMRLEEQLKKGSQTQEIEIENYEKRQAKSNKANLLSKREKDIVACIAKGMSNKEIAKQLCLSVNTVTTHRRNISIKLRVHSAASITIFAIANKLVEIPDKS